ncbi:MAG TPA: hypothetical protein VN723_05495 [Rhizomicrobium sp.]|jgi:hypothetical protein|nr:hypothetical protein [Rhizomicrobium sp.]
MFPPPQPWKQRTSVDPQREYLAFTSCFYLKSFRRVPAFLATSFAIMKQANAAPGAVGWSLGLNLFSLEFHTLSAWEDAPSLRRFIHAGPHGGALRLHKNDMRRKSTLVYFKVLGRELPLTWKDAFARQERQNQSDGAVSKSL